MTTTIANPLFQRIATAVSGAVALLPTGEELAVSGAVQGVPAELTLPSAVIASFQGTVSGELALLVDAEVVGALQASPTGDADLAVALRPALDAIAAGLQVALSTPQTVAGPMALRRLAAQDEVATVALNGVAGVRAAVVVGAAATPMAFPPVTAADTRPPGARLDLLRGVEMQASVELGRASLTLNDLLNLRDGAVIELDRAAGEAADLSINGRLIARGEIVVVDENYALRITEILTGETGA